MNTLGSWWKGEVFLKRSSLDGASKMPMSGYCSLCMTVTPGDFGNSFLIYFFERERFFFSVELT